MSISPMLQWEQEFNFHPGDSVVVIKNPHSKKSIRRKGRIVWVGDLFVCIWIYSLMAPDRHGWRECFFYSDIEQGHVSIDKRIKR